MNRSVASRSADPEPVSAPRGARRLYRWRYDLMVVGAAILCRLLFLFLQRQSDPLLFLPVVDEQTYLEDARQWAASGFSTAGLKLPFWQPPGYMLLLSLWIGAGGTPTGFILVQLMLGVIGSWLIFRIIINLFGAGALRMAVGAGLVYSLCPAILYYETKLLKPAWSIFLTLVLLALSFPREKSSWWFVRGLLSGVLVLFEAYLLVFPLALLLAAGRRWTASLAVLAGLAVVVVPVLRLNVDAVGALIPVAYNGPINLYVGNNANWHQTYNTLPGWDWDQISMRYDSVAPAGSMNVVERSRFFVADVRQYALQHPVQFTRGLFAKALLFCSARELPRDGAIFLHPLASLLGFAVNALLVLVALLAIPRVRREPLLIIPLALIVLVNVAFFPTTRYRLAVIPLTLIASGSLAGLPKFIWWRGAWLVALSLVAAGSLLAGRVVRYEAWLAFSLNEAAWTHLHRGDASRARDLVQKALQACRLPMALNTAGQLAMGEDHDTGTALRLFDEAIRIEPGFPDPYFNRGRVEESMARLEAAYRSYVSYLDRTHLYMPSFSATDARSSIKALEFTARMDFEQGRPREALARLLHMREIQRLGHLGGTPIIGLDQQIEMLQKHLSDRAPYGKNMSPYETQR